MIDQPAQTDLMWDIPAAGTQMDLSGSPFATGRAANAPSYMDVSRGVPALIGIDPRFLHTWRRLPGFHKISTTIGNSRLSGADYGGAAGDQVKADFFKPIVVQFGQKPYERRGFVVSYNNQLVFRYYNTKTAAWSSRTLVSNLDNTFGTRTNFDVVSEGRFLYVSRTGYTPGGSTTVANAPAVFWWEDNTGWTAVGGNLYFSNTYQQVRAADSNGFYLWAGGDFGIRQFDGFTWSDVGGGLKILTGGVETPATVEAIYWSATEGLLYVGGHFDRAVQPDGSNLDGLNNIAAWDGFKWLALGVGTGTDVLAITGIGLDIYVGGSFVAAGGIGNTWGIAHWTGAGGWTAMGTGGASASVLALTNDGVNVYAGGTFTLMGGVANTQRLAKWNGAAWSSITPTVADGPIRALKYSTNLYVGGAFAHVNAVAAVSIAYYDGTWHAMGTGVAGGSATVSSIEAHTFSDRTTKIVIGGSFTSAGGTTASCLAYWTGAAWVSLDNGGSSASSLIVKSFLAGGMVGPLLFAGTGPTTFDTTVDLNYAGLWRDSLRVEYQAVVGASQWTRWVTSTFGTVSTQNSSALFTKDCYYSFFVRFISKPRGFVSPPSDVRTFTVAAGTETSQRYVDVTLLQRVIQSSRPTHVQLWRTIGSSTDLTKGGGPNQAGPYFLDKELLIDADAQADVTVRLAIGTPDTYLVEQTPFNPLYDLAGNHEAGSAIGSHKGQLFTMSGQMRPKGSESGGETFFSIRWSPPWARDLERTAYQGYYRTRAAAGETPRFIEAGDYLIFACRRQFIRIQKQGDYVQFLDGPSEKGPCNREAITAIGGSLAFITSSGELMLMNSSTGGMQPVEAVGRWLNTRWKRYVESGQMALAYDAASDCLILAPLPATTDSDYPVEVLIVHMPDEKAAIIADVFPRAVIGGVDPETGQSTAFVLTRNGMILAPDWGDRGVWNTDGTWGDVHFMTVSGTTGQRAFAVSGLADQGGGVWRLSGAATLELDTTFKPLMPGMLYLFRQNDNQDPSDSVTRYQLVAVGRITTHTGTTVDVKFSGETAGRIFHNDALANFATWTNVRAIVTPVVSQVIMPPLRHPSMPGMNDRMVVQSINSIVGWFEGTIDPAQDFALYSAVVLDRDGWRFDNPKTYGPIIPFPTNGDTDPNPMSRSFDLQSDKMWAAVEHSGHTVFPVVMTFSPDRLMEWVGASVLGQIDKSRYAGDSG